MVNVFPLHPQHPELICWAACNHYCAASDMRCGNGQSRTQHPALCQRKGSDAPCINCRASKPACGVSTRKSRVQR